MRVGVRVNIGGVIVRVRTLMEDDNDNNEGQYDTTFGDKYPAKRVSFHGIIVVCDEEEEKVIIIIFFKTMYCHSSDCQCVDDISGV